MQTQTKLTLGETAFKTWIALDSLDAARVGPAYRKLIDTARQAKTRQSELEYKVNACKQDWRNGDPMFYRESIVSTAADYERKLAEYKMAEDSFIDAFVDFAQQSKIAVSEETIREVILLARIHH